MELAQLKSLEADPQLVLARFSPCGKFLCGASYDARVRRWDATADDWSEKPAIEGHGGWVTALAFAASGARLYSGDSWGQLRCSNYAAAEKPAALWSNATAHDGWLRDIAVSPDGSRIATCGIDKRVRVWSAADGAKQLDFALGDGPAFVPRNGSLDGDAACLRFTPDGKSLIVADLKGQIEVWELDGLKRGRKFDAGVLFKYDRLQDVGGVRCLATDAGFQWLAVGGTIPKNGGSVTGVPTALVFDFASGELKHTLSFGQTTDCYVSDLAFHPRGFLVATTCGTPGSGQLIVQKPGDKEPLFTTKKMANCQSLTLHPDGERLAVVATNSGSNGNGRPLTKDGAYVTNKSPVAIWKLPA